jgi:NADPH2 dehydrogenase
VHGNGSFIYLQLWALGRAAHADVLRQEGGYPLVAPSAIPLPKHDAPRPLTVAEIGEYVRLFGVAAGNAVHKAGFDGVEIHAANGYLPDQFLQTNTNERTDEYGGPEVRNRVRFVLEITSAVVAAIGADRVGIRLSPWSTFQGEFFSLRLLGGKTLGQIDGRRPAGVPCHCRHEDARSCPYVFGGRDAHPR